jgi:hypothetical protein
MQEFFEEQAGEAAGVVADDAVFFEEVVEDDAETELLERREIDGHGLGALRAVATGDVGRDGLAIGNDPIDDAGLDVILDGTQMIGERVAGSFAGLGHEIGDVDARGFGFGDGGGDFRDQKIGQDACVERAGAEEDEVGVLDGFNDGGKRAHLARRKFQLLDRRATGSNASFAVDDAAVLERGDEMNVRKRGRKNAAADGQDFAADADGFGEIARDVSERGEKKIAEIVADETASGVETVLKQAAEKSFVFGKRDHAVADVARRKNAVLAAQAAGAAAVVGDGDDGGEVGNGALGGGVLIGASDDVFFKAAEERGEAGAAAESDDAEAAGESFRLGSSFLHVRTSGNGDTSLYRVQKGVQHGERRQIRVLGQFPIIRVHVHLRLNTGSSRYLTGF